MVEDSRCGGGGRCRGQVAFQVHAADVHHFAEGTSHVCWCDSVREELFQYGNCGCDEIGGSEVNMTELVDLNGVEMREDKEAKKTSREAAL